MDSWQSRIAGYIILNTDFRSDPKNMSDCLFNGEASLFSDTSQA